MPSRRYGRYIFYFYGADLVREPIHYHVDDGGRTAKYWLDPIRCASTGGIKSHDLGKIERVIQDNYTALVDLWKEEREKL